MTTIKEYKAMMDGASDGLLPCPFDSGKPVLRPSNFGYYISVQIPCEKYEYQEIWRTPYWRKKEDCINFWNTRADKLTPELIRVMELMGEALQYCADWYQGGDAVTEALSEYRKLRGE